ncbi:MAG: 2-phosphosulfolactate phosphatase [candidate division WOR-3 bacterium]|nr:MAG: 2-phosphosulfolactate phosphatase [candidate division WOR-3 bacterium]
MNIEPVVFMKHQQRNARTPNLTLDWGVDGMRYALQHNDVTVVVDTLRFSTAVVTAVANGFTIYPVADRESGRNLAASIGANIAGKPGEGKYTISPHTYINAPDEHNKNVVLFSPNGAACSALVGSGQEAYVGCLLNARAVGEHITSLARRLKINVTLIAAGEQRALDTGERIVYEKKSAYRVFAIEDYLACGAILHYSELAKSAEAQVCEYAFKGAHGVIEDLLLESFSGRYLVQHDLRKDVTHAARLNSYDVIPCIREGRIAGLSGEERA